MVYFLYNLCKIDHPQVDKVFEELFFYFCPSDTSGKYYDYHKNCPQIQKHRAHCWESWVNADAIFYYLTGFEPEGASPYDVRKGVILKEKLDANLQFGLEFLRKWL